jgi:hypothetical protein
MPYSPLEVNRRFRRTYRLHVHGRRISRAVLGCILRADFLAYSSILKMEATCSSETSPDIQRTVRCYGPQDGTLEILKLFIFLYSINKVYDKEVTLIHMKLLISYSQRLMARGEACLPSTCILLSTPSSQL